MTDSAVMPRSRTRLWLDLARAGNFPSVWSNVVAALVLSQSVRGEWPSPSVLVLALIAGSLAYAGGTTLNDVADVAFDSVHRPERAIPRGRAIAPPPYPAGPSTRRRGDRQRGAHGPGPAWL